MLQRSDIFQPHFTLSYEGYVSDRDTYTDKKGNKIFHIYKEIQMGAVAKSFRRKFFL